MSKEELISKILTATPAQLDSVAAVLAGGEAIKPNMKAITQKEAGTLIGRSSRFVYRLLKAGKLKPVMTEGGCMQVLYAYVVDYLNARA